MASVKDAAIPNGPINEKIIIRRMQPADIPFMARMAATEYLHSELNDFIQPWRHQYPDDYIRNFDQLIQKRYFSGRSIGFVAVSSLRPQVPVAYAQFGRLGNDTAARRLMESQRSLWFSLQGWYAAIRMWVVNFLWPSRSLDSEALRKFLASAEHDKWTYWDAPELKERYQNRWQALSVVVSSDYQRRGIGKRLMCEILGRAEEEGVVVGLEASEDGEKLYRSLGFELRGHFSMVIGRPVGGIMMWTPRKLQR